MAKHDFGIGWFAREMLGRPLYWYQEEADEAIRSWPPLRGCGVDCAAKEVVRGGESIVTLLRVSVMLLHGGRKARHYYIRINGTTGIVVAIPCGRHARPATLAAIM